ncbi:hypothetical protein EB822_10745 [Flavobacteriaceae bacterium PRS1]|nr:hypothetical protein EB822_10745 [Flavobacteriaceae bacterium PRS1]
MIKSFKKKLKNIFLKAVNRKFHRQLRTYFPPQFQNKTIGSYIILNYIKSNKISGDIVECGVGRGVSIFSFANICNLIGLKKLIYGYDSFDGFPEPTTEDNSIRKPQKGEWSDTYIHHVREHFIFEGLDKYFDDFIRLVPVFFDQSLPPNKLKDIAFLHLDCDLYMSYKTCIRYLYPKLSKGAIVLYDEFNHPKWPGATKAISESLSSSKRILFYSNILDKYLSVESVIENSENFMKLMGQLKLTRYEI